MAKFCRVLGAFMIVIAVLVGMIATPKISNACSAEAGQTIATLLETNFATEESLANHGILASEVNTFTPMLDTALVRLDGVSYTPTLKGEEGHKHIDSTIDVSANVSGVDATDVNLTKSALEFWVNIDMKPNLITRGLTIILSDELGENKIVWAIATDEIRSLFTREELTDFDAKIFGSVVSNAPIGWVKLTLPIVAGAVTGELISSNKFTFKNLTISQTAETGSDQEMSFYNIKLVTINQSQTENSSYISSYSAIKLDSTAKVLADTEDYYIGERFPQFMSRRDVFLCCWIGNINYLDGAHDSSLKVLTDSGIGSSSKEYFPYGSSSFTIKASQYIISYGLDYGGRFVGLLTDTMFASNYGKGVWLDSSIEELEIGSETKIYFDVHQAFSNATIKFESTDEEILQISEVNTVNKYIIVKAIKKGDVGIEITITDDRLQGTDYEETGIINTDFEIEVVKVAKKVNTTQVMLWIAFGLLCVGLIYLAIKAIIDSKKIEIR